MTATLDNIDTSAYTGVDFYDTDDLFTDEERMVRDSVRQLVDEAIMPVITESWRDGVFPRSVVGPIAEAGLLGANLDLTDEEAERYDCQPVGPVGYGLAMQELERGDSGIRSFCSVQGALVMYPIHTFGSEAQKDHWLPRLARGESIGCFGLTEPDFGSDPGGMLTTAVKDGDSYVLNGSKMWITNGSQADVAVVWAKVRDEGDRVRGFIVEASAPGFEARETHGKHSLRASDTSELYFTDCRIPASNLLPKTEGLKNALMCLTAARYGIAWGAIGAAQACYDQAVKYAKTRIMFGKPIGGFQMIQTSLAEMLSEITKAQLIAWRLGELKKQGRAKHYHVSLAKRNNVKIALDIARSARDVLGANGILDEYPVFRHMANLETVITYEGTHNIHTLVLGEQITGIPAYR